MVNHIDNIYIEIANGNLEFKFKEIEVEKISIRKSSKSKSLLMDKKKMEIINEYLLYYIINRIQYDLNEIEETDYLDKIKVKLHLNRITNADKANIIKNFKEIYTIVKEEYTQNLEIE